MATPPSKKKKSVKCPCGAEDIELVRDEDGDWSGKCSECGRNLGRSTSIAEREADHKFFSTPEAPPKKEKGW